MPGGPCGEPWAGSRLLTDRVPQNPTFFFFFKKKKPPKTQHPHVCDPLEYGVTATNWLLRNDARAGWWPLQACLTTEACSASSYCASFLLHLICHLVASEVGNSSLNMTFRHAASASCSVCLNLAIEEVCRGAGHCDTPWHRCKPPPRRPVSRAASHQPQQLLTPHCILRDAHKKFLPPWVLLTALSCLPIMFKAFLELNPHLTAHLTPLSQHLNQMSGGEEAIHFTFQHSVMAETCNKIHRLVKIQVFQEKN